MRDDTAISADILHWYDHHARILPWRVSPADRAAGVRPDPYRVWLSEVMLQQTTVAAVRSYFRTFTQAWPTVSDLAAADDGDVMAAWAGLGYYARARNLLKCARVVADQYTGHFPNTAAKLLTLPGIGPYTAAAVASIAFDEPATVVDGNVERVISRLFALTDPLPGSRPRIAQLAATVTPRERPGDYAQAMMDLGATICTPRNPACGICPLRPDCAGFAQGIAAELPKKTPKQPKPTRHGFAYVGRASDGAILLERRPDKGLLGGTLGFPGSDWGADPDPVPPRTADWTVSGEVRHTFTHFHLILTVMVAQIPTEPALTPAAQFNPASLPTVMRKVWDGAQPGICELTNDT
ncbi:A/G-specific adenine glycosylase [Thioclava sp. SK-1]|uniref:A/G-specific adenine glycosylase n=1 Tax=Thioclava sp. SK-1 TaxID=1889770 RepID=UPI00082580A0|nr:A/G-specific adenine glycosylase [Thioclava sp. SK-1]OCX65760.1 A/G-specific adenine glycosylase [Thioclava sp. SK-1]